MRIIFIFLIFASGLVFSEENLAMHYFQRNEKTEHTDTEVDTTCSKHVIDVGCCFNTGMFFSGDFLLWRAHNYATCYVIRNYDDSIGQPYQPGYEEIITREYQTIDSKWDPGFRIKTGYNTPYDQWTLTAAWTHYNTKHVSSLTVDDYSLDGLNFYDGSPFLWSDIERFNYARGSWQLNYNAWDLDLGKTFYVIKKLSLKPFIGLRGASLYQKKHYFYNDFEYASIAYFHLPSISTKNNYWGVGPRFGLTTDWHLAKYFTFFGDASFSLLFGEVDYQSEMSWISTINLTQDLITNYNYNNYYEMKPTASILLGFSTGGCFHNDKLYFGLNFAFEYNYYWDQNFDKNFIEEDEFLNSITGGVDMLGMNIGAVLEF